MLKLVLGMLAVSFGGVFAHPELVVQDIPALAGFRLGSHRSAFALQDCRNSPPLSGAPEGKQVLRCVANDSVAVYFADDELYLVFVMRQVALTPADRWQEVRNWATHTFGEPDTVDLSVPNTLLNIIWRANAVRPWQLKIHLLARPPGTLSMMEYVDCRRARPGFCTR
jgi:hypothetical protein